MPCAGNRGEYGGWLRLARCLSGAPIVQECAGVATTTLFHRGDGVRRRATVYELALGVW